MECAICYEKYNENLLPMVLLCGHSFCTECTKKLENRESIKCPMCKKITAIAIPPNTHSEKYPNDLLIPNLTLTDALLIKTNVEAPKNIDHLFIKDNIIVENANIEELMRLIDNMRREEQFNDIAPLRNPAHPLLAENFQFANGFRQRHNIFEQRPRCCNMLLWRVALFSAFTIMISYTFVTAIFMALWIITITDQKPGFNIFYFLSYGEAVSHTIWLATNLYVSVYIFFFYLQNRFRIFPKRNILIFGAYKLAINIFAFAIYVKGMEKYDQHSDKEIGFSKLLFLTLIEQGVNLAMYPCVKLAKYSYEKIRGNICCC